VWNADGKRWDCEVCNQTVDQAGPWCAIYRKDVGLCRPYAKVMLRTADAQGDGSLVNALCEFGRKKWGPDLEW
jgi:hypothetical protein